MLDVYIKINYITFKYYYFNIALYNYLGIEFLKFDRSRVGQLFANNKFYYKEIELKVIIYIYYYIIGDLY